MPSAPVAGNSYIEIDDSGGAARNLSAWVEEVEPVGQQVSAVDVTGLNDTSRQVAAGVEPVQEFVLRGLFDATPITGPDAVLAGIVGKAVTVAYGPAGNAAGAAQNLRRISLPVLPGRRPCRGGPQPGPGPLHRPLPPVRAGDAGRVVKSRRRGRPACLPRVLISSFFTRRRRGTEVRGTLCKPPFLCVSM